MARRDSERSLHSPQSMQPGSTVCVNTGSEPPLTELAPSESATCTDNSSTIKVNAGNSVVCATGNASSTTVPSPLVSSISSSSWDSRIPRPSSTGLRRSLSMRIHGERVSPNHPPPPSTATTAALNRHYQQYRRTNHHQHQQYHHLDHRTFPVITENGTESPRQRSLSLSLTPVRPRSGHAAPGGSDTGIADDSDTESVKSSRSAYSTASACDHATFALNGTTWSGRSRKYVVHCSNHTGDNETYLTPTQRAALKIKKFQALLEEAQKKIKEKDEVIFRLTKEVVELRLYKASLNSPDERTDSSDALTVRENNPFSPESPSKDLPDEATLQKNTNLETPEKRAPSDLPSSLADSGHFEDGSVHSKDSVYLPEVQTEAIHIATTPNKVPEDTTSDTFDKTTITDTQEIDEERRKLVNLYESRIEEMHRRHVDELQELKQKHNNKVESLLNQLAEVNTRYCEMRPCIDAAEARARELEAELEAVKTEFAEQKTLLNEQEERNKQMYLKMYAKGQEAARIEQADQILQHAHQTPPKVTVAELLQQLTVTQAELENIKDTSYSPEPHISADRSQSLLSAQEAVSLWVLGTRKAMYRRIVEARSNQGALDPEITLQFLKSAIYYFLTDKENHHGHLNAIESILGFTEAEKHNIDKIYRSTRK
ncbi:Protein quick-to-court [Anthophora retusa]